MKYKWLNRSLWYRGYYADMVEQNEITIKKYIENQLKEDRLFE